MNLLLAIRRQIRITFKVALAVAIILHLLGLLLYALKYQPRVVEVPFKPLQVKLGDVRFSSSPAMHRPAQKATPKMQPRHAVPQPLPHTIQTIPLQKPKEKPKKLPKKIKDTLVKKPERMVEMPLDLVPKPMKPQPSENAKSAQKARKAKAQQSATVPGAYGHEHGNEKRAEQEVITTYEQKLSLWLARHKRYPDAARAQKLEGRGIVYLKIDRQGNILFAELVMKTGYPVLDQAILDMVDRANPVPPFPADYPPWQIVGFRIPVGFVFER